MALVVTVRPFSLNGRLHAVGSILTDDDAARVQAIPSLRSLCVSTDGVKAAAQTPNAVVPPASTSTSEGT